MKLKIRYLRGGEADEWTSEEEHILHRWDMIALSLAVLITIAALIAGQTAPASLAESAPGGFVLWFLTCCSYPILGLIGIVNWLLHTQQSEVMQYLVIRHPVLGLWIADMVTCFAVWGIGRLCGLRRTVAPQLRIAGNFLLILTGWGVFQLLLFGISSIMHYGGFGR